MRNKRIYQRIIVSFSKQSFFIKKIKIKQNANEQKTNEYRKKNEPGKTRFTLFVSMKHLEFV